MTLWFCLANHSALSQESLLDAVLPMLGALKGIGYDARMTDHVMDTGVNILFDSFTDQHVNQLLTAPVKFGIVATEWYENGVFNGGNSIDHEDRLRNFLLLSNRALFVWALADAPDYRKLGLPYAATLIGHEETCLSEKDAAPFIDFVAYGEWSVERARLVGELRDAGVQIVWPGAKIPKQERDRIVQSGKYVLGFSPISGVSHFSTTRMASAINLWRPFVSFEPLPSSLGSVVPYIREREAREIVDRLINLSSVYFRDQHYEQLEVFKREYSMREIMRVACEAVGLESIEK